MKTKPVTIRFPECLHKKLVAFAKEDERSFNGQVVHVLKSDAEKRALKKKQPDR